MKVVPLTYGEAAGSQPPSNVPNQLRHRADFSAPIDRWAKGDLWGGRGRFDGGARTSEGGAVGTEAGDRSPHDWTVTRRLVDPDMDPRRSVLLRPALSRHGR